MKRRPHSKADPIEGRIELAFCPGEFIYDRACFSFVSGLEEVAATIKKLSATEPARAVALYEAFLAGCHAKADELDTETAAKRLEKTHPGLAARLWLAQGMRIVDAKKSKYYDAALSNFERARDGFQRAGMAAEWNETVRRVCASHYRKTGFIGGFQALATGGKHGDRPSFLERAKARWGERHGEGS